MWTPTNRRRHGRDNLRYETDLAYAEVAMIKPMLPSPLEGARAVRWPLRQIVDAIFKVL